jgi:hypothetical protein
MSCPHQELAMKTRFLVMALGLKQMRGTTALALAVSAGLLGCAAPATGPVARADGTFTITRQAQNQQTPRAQVTTMATQDAEAHCLKIGKKFKAIQKRETITAGNPTSEVVYACD